jgi:site-specific DNA-methyltransferase (adenine-specific)
VTTHQPSIVTELPAPHDVHCLGCAKPWPCADSQPTPTHTFHADSIHVHAGDSREVLARIPTASIDAIVTDPPYELGFMGKTWDSTGIAYDIDLWRECLRVLKPGGHLLSFGGTRTYHRMTCAVEDAGFEIRDSIHWLNGNGFPKSLDVSKAIDKGQGENRQRQLKFTEWMRSTGITASQIDDITSTHMGNHYLTDLKQPAIATADLFDQLRPHLPEVPEYIERLIAERTGIEWTAYQQRPKLGEREVPVNHAFCGPTYHGETTRKTFNVTAPATADAEHWQGWGTGLKPAHEPIVVARKPLAGTVAGNVLAHGTGALNIDGCRIGTDDTRRLSKDSPLGILNDDLWQHRPTVVGSASGRWPANIVITHTADCGDDCASDCPAATLDQQNNGASRFFTTTEWHPEHDAPFYYSAKAPQSERPRHEDTGLGHMTVKPLALMQWLVRLVTPPGGTVLDPFAGTGTTLEAAAIEGFNAVGIELEPDHIPLIVQRLNRDQQGTLPL